MPELVFYSDMGVEIFKRMGGEEYAMFYQQKLVRPDFKSFWAAFDYFILEFHPIT